MRKLINWTYKRPWVFRTVIVILYPLAPVLAFVAHAHDAWPDMKRDLKEFYTIWPEAFRKGGPLNE